MDHRMALPGPDSFGLGANHWYSQLSVIGWDRTGTADFQRCGLRGVALGLPAASVLQDSGSEPRAALLSGWLTVLESLESAVGLVGGDRDPAEYLECTGQPPPRRMF